MKSTRGWYAVANKWMLCSFVLLCMACSRSTQSETVKGRFVSEIGEPLFDVSLEVVSTPEARAKGLMFRRDLAENTGMLFVFPKEEKHSFWMKNTQISLDMIFLSKDKKVVEIVERATPFSEESRGGAAPSLYVVEVPGGVAYIKQIRVGSKLELEREITTLR